MEGAAATQLRNGSEPRPVTTIRGHRAVPTNGRANAKVVLAATDLGAVILAMVLAFPLQEAMGRDFSPRDIRSILLISALTVPLWMVAFARTRLYSTRYLARRPDELRRIARATITAGMAMGVLSFILERGIPRTWFVLTLLLGFVLVGIEREVARRLFRRLRRKGRFLRRVVIVGTNEESAELAAMLDGDQAMGYEVVGFLSDGVSAVEPELATQILGSVSDAIEVIKDCGAISVLMATTATDTESSNRLVRQLTDVGIHVELSSTLRDIAAERLTVRPLGRFPVVYVAPVLRHGWRVAAKRAFDLTFGGLGLLFASPLVAGAALLIRLDSHGPVVFRQMRVGRDGKAFEVMKFRTMVNEAEELVAELQHRNEASGPLFKIHHDPRTTRVGRFLRRTSIDELPQLWNVLRGEMSLVGPRPALPSEVAHWTPVLHERLRVKPGITGMWQVHGRATSSFDDYVRLDLYYVDNWSLFADLTILAKTVPTVLSRRGAW